MKTFFKKHAVTIGVGLLAVISSFLVVDYTKYKDQEKQALARGMSITNSVHLILKDGFLVTDASSRPSRLAQHLPENLGITIEGKTYRNLIIEYIKIHNTGSEVINESDFLDPLTATPPKGAQLIPIHYNSESDKKTIWNARVTDDNKIYFPKITINPNERFTFRVGYTLPDKNIDLTGLDWVWEGRVKGITEPKKLKLTVDDYIQEIYEKRDYRQMIIKSGNPGTIGILLFDWDIPIFLAILAVVFFVTYNTFYRTRKQHKDGTKKLIKLTILSTLCVSTADILFYILFRLETTYTSIALYLWLPLIFIHGLFIFLYREKSNKKA